MKMYLYVNSVTGKKFKTTETGRKKLGEHAQLKKTCKFLGECDEKGQLLKPGTGVLQEKTVESIREIMNKNKSNGTEQKPAEPEGGEKE